MSKVIFKTRFNKSGKGVGKGYVRYIAERDGVDKSINAKIGDINAKYIATRPGVIKLGEHGLFGQKDDVNLEKAIEDVTNHTGIVWRPIISMRREDADRLGYNNPYRWRTLLRSMQYEFAKSYRIPIDDLVWYAAFHDEGHHPHIHMIIYNKNPGGEFITKVGWANLKEKFTKNIFKDDLKQLYDERMTLRDKMIEEAQNRMDINDISIGEADDEFINAYNELKFSLEGYKGTKKYKFLSKEQKEKVNELVKKVCQDENIKNVYAEWCKIQMAILRIFHENPEECFGEIYDNKDLEYRIRNVIVESAFKSKNRIAMNDAYYKTQTANMVYGDIVFSMCQMIDKSIDDSIPKEGFTKSIVDSKERKKELKHKEDLGIKMSGW